MPQVVLSLMVLALVHPNPRHDSIGLRHECHYEDRAAAPHFRSFFQVYGGDDAVTRLGAALSNPVSGGFQTSDAQQSGAETSHVSTSRAWTSGRLACRGRIPRYTGRTRNREGNNTSRHQRFLLLKLFVRTTNHPSGGPSGGCGAQVSFWS